MATKFRLQLRNVQNVAASKTAVIDVPVGFRYHYIMLQHGFTAGTNTIAGAASNITEIRVLVNGRVQRVFSGTQLRDLNLLNSLFIGDSTGLPNTAPGVSFGIFFNEPWRDSPGDSDRLAWPTVRKDGSNFVDSIQIQVDLGAASTPTLQAWAMVDKVSAEDAGFLGFVKYLRFQQGAAGTKFDINITDRRDFLQQITLYPDSGASNAPTPVTLRIAGQVVHELVFTANTALNTHQMMTSAASGRTANLYDLVLDHDGLLASAVDMNGVRDATVTVEAAAAMSGTTTYFVIRLGPLE